MSPPRFEEEGHVLDISLEAGRLCRTRLDGPARLEEDTEVLRDGRGTVRARVDALWEETSE
jgi:hypothetical protein